MIFYNIRTKQIKKRYKKRISFTFLDFNLRLSIEYFAVASRCCLYTDFPRIAILMV